MPLTCHWYDGVVPPKFAVELKLTIDPAQKGLADALTEMLTGRFGLTVTATGMLVAGFPEVHASEEVITQVTRSPDEGVQLKTALLEPPLDPFTFHWYEGVNPPNTGEAV